MSKKSQERAAASSPVSWACFTNHAHVLAELFMRPHTPLRLIAEEMGITERSVQSIVSDLEKNGVLRRERSGRNNSYTINRDSVLSHFRERHRCVAELLQFLQPADATQPVKLLRDDLTTVSAQPHSAQKSKLRIVLR